MRRVLGQIKVRNVYWTLEKLDRLQGAVFVVIDGEVHPKPRSPRIRICLDDPKIGFWNWRPEIRQAANRIFKTAKLLFKTRGLRLKDSGL